MDGSEKRTPELSIDREWLESFDGVCLENDQMRGQLVDLKAEAERVRAMTMQGIQRRLWPLFSWERKPSSPEGEAD